MAFLRYSLVLIFCSIYRATSDTSQLEDPCMVVLNSFANVSAGFTYCTIRNARPVTMCQQCVSLYTEVKTVYDDINEFETEGGSVCASELVNLDRLEVFSSGYKYISTLWQKARCDTCFEPSESGGPSEVLTDSVKELLNASSVYKDCLKTYLNESTGNTTLVCEKCASAYSAMNDIFDQIEISLDGGICMDIVDLMNSTRNEWSQELKCCLQRRTPELFLAFSIAGVMACTILFYLISYIVVPKGAQTVLQEKRWREISSIASKRKSSERRRSSASTDEM